MIKLDVLKDGIDKTMEILGQHFPHPKIESIGRTRITVEFYAYPTAILKFSKLYYIVKDRFANPWIIESSDAIDAVVEMYDELQAKHNNEVALFAQTSRSLLDKRKDNVRLRRQLAENKKRIEELSKPKSSEICTLCWDGISKMRQNYKALTFVLAEPDPEPSIAEQEVMQAEVAQMPKAREIVNVYVRLRIKLVNRRKVQVLELVERIYENVLDAGQEIVYDIPFNADAHELVKQFNQVCCLPPRFALFESTRIFYNFTSYAQEVYRNGKNVRLIIGVPTE